MGPRTSPQYLVETNTLRRTANSPKCRWKFTNHALERMAERGITAPDVQRAVKHGQIIFHEVKKDLILRVEGKDVDGARIQVSVAVYEMEILIKVITTF
jgi:hypothetical protein